MWLPIKSSWGIIYYIDKDIDDPRFLLLKRYALSKRIEWVAPKWKVDEWELPENTALREVYEEVWIPYNKMQLKEKAGDMKLALFSEDRWSLNKDISYYIIEYLWNPYDIKVPNIEWFIWVYEWFKIEDILSLVYYENFRELFRTAYNKIKTYK